ncbi:MAG: response regulator transcription factor [Candidatus Delongbacteria bacterium]
MSTLPRILIVEDDPHIRELICRALEDGSRQCETCADLKSALQRLHLGLPDLLILDRVLPGGDGLRILQKVREVSNLPVLLLTSLRSEDHKVEGLEAGADDYLGKPFSLRELSARVNALLRRSRIPAGVSLRLGALSLDSEGRQAFRGEQPLDLSPLEVRVLKTLLLNQERVLRRDELIGLAWGVEYEGYDRAVDTLVVRLRRKLTGPGMPQVRTVRGQGYSLSLEEDA